jgi:hypothetical protein
MALSNSGGRRGARMTWRKKLSDDLLVRNKAFLQMSVSIRRSLTYPVLIRRLVELKETQLMPPL